MISNSEKKKRKNTDQNETSGSNEEKNCESFVCFCGKSYCSFPALYLHSKTKHQVLLKVRQKETMVKRKQWSGKKKKIIYEFPEDSEEDQLNEEEGEEKKQQTQPKKSRTRREEKENDEATIEEALELLVHDALFYFKEF